VLIKVVVYYKYIYINVNKNKFGYDLKLLSFLKMKHWIYKELKHFQNFIFSQKWWRNNMSCTLTWYLSNNGAFTLDVKLVLNEILGGTHY